MQREDEEDQGRGGEKERRRKSLSKKKYYDRKCDCGQKWCDCVVGKHRDWVRKKYYGED